MMAAELIDAPAVTGACETDRASLARSLAAAARRRVLYLAAVSKCQGVCTDLRSRGWVVEHATEPSMVAGHAAGGDILAGLLMLHTADQLEWVEHLRGEAREPAMEWIALVSPEALDAPPVQEFVSTSCFDFHTLPADLERLESALGHAQGMAQLARTVHANAGAHNAHGDALLVSESAAMKGVLATTEKYARSDLPVLIGGESGTGKEQVALTLHARSPRAGAPFVAVNCAALTPSLMQSELFGHEKGAFTGAHRRRIGRIEAASGGTILLDEVGDLPPEVQVSLLRFLEERTIERVGASEPVTVDVRVVAATHVDLRAAIAQGTFREDLFHRLSVLNMQVPPLRERPEDVAVLAHHFLARLPREPRARARGFTASAIQALRQHDWPGNVRELLNRVSQGALLCEGRHITRKCLGLERRERSRCLMSLKDARHDAERKAILASLDRAGANLTQAAQALDISRSYLYTLMERHGLGPGRDG